jgi:hypothetical protein
MIFSLLRRTLMNENRTIDTRINQYLDAVRAQLSGLSHDEVEGIIDDLRTHIDSSIQAHGDQPTLENVKAVLEEMDPPESFAPDLEDTVGVVPKVSRPAIWGAGFLPFGILIAILFLVPAVSANYSIVDGVPTGNLPETTWWQWLLRFTILPLGIASPFVTTILGLVSLSQIRASKGKLIGKPLALIDALFYPLLVFDGLFVALLFLIIASIPDGHLALTETMALMGYILVVIIDLIIVAVAWLKIR